MYCIQGHFYQISSAKETLWLSVLLVYDVFSVWESKMQQTPVPSFYVKTIRVLKREIKSQLLQVTTDWFLKQQEFSWLHRKQINESFLCCISDRAVFRWVFALLLLLNYRCCQTQQMGTHAFYCQGQCYFLKKISVIHGQFLHFSLVPPTFLKHSRVFFSSSHTNRQTDELGRFTLAEERAGDVTARCLRWQVQVWSVYKTFYLSNNPECLIHHQVWIPLESLMDNRTAGWLTFKRSFAMNRSKRMWFLIWLQYKSYTWTTTTKYTQTWFCSCAQTNQYSRSHYGLVLLIPVFLFNWMASEWSG